MPQVAILLLVYLPIQEPAKEFCVIFSAPNEVISQPPAEQKFAGNRPLITVRHQLPHVHRFLRFCPNEVISQPPAEQPNCWLKAMDYGAPPTGPTFTVATYIKVYLPIQEPAEEFCDISSAPIEVVSQPPTEQKCAELNMIDYLQKVIPSALNFVQLNLENGERLALCCNGGTTRMGLTNWKTPSMYYNA
ncbi:hypothetical protein R6Q59_030091 [Mikania micrantha]